MTLAGTVCLVPRGRTLETSRPCGQPAGRIVTVGCRHEHISTKVLCDEHANLLLARRATTGQMWCQRCLTIDNHKCAMSAKEDT